MDIRWIRSDGAGGIFVRNGDELLRIDSIGRVDRLPLAASPLEGPPLSATLFPDSPGELWAMSPGNGDTLGLFLASGNSRDWHRTIFTLAPLSASTLGGDTVPLPRGWKGPDGGKSPAGRSTNGRYAAERPAGFARERAGLVSDSDRTWIALGELLIMRKDSDWTFFFAKDQSLFPLQSTGEPDGKTPSLSHRLTRAVPYLYTGFLAVSAMRSGPGWERETGWALGGFVPGALVGGLLSMGWMGYCASPSSGCKSEALTLLPVFVVPLATGLWAVASHPSAERRDRTWVRAGAATLGAVSGAGLYFAFPEESGWMYLGAIAGASLGMVAGYRLAWFE